MRLTLICLESGNLRLAGGYRVEKFVTCLVQAGHDVTVVTSLSGRTGPGKTLAVPYRTVGQGRAFGRLLNRLLYWPEPQRAWVRPVVDQLEGVVGDSDALLVSTPPHSVQIIGVELARRTGVPYVADFRDDWLTNHRVHWHTPLHRRVAARWERRVVEEARAVILNTQVVRSRFQARYPWAASRLHALTNGYDEGDFSPDAAGPAFPPDGRKTLLYMGGMYGQYLYRQFGDLAAAFRATGLAKHWRIVSAGETAPAPDGAGDVWTHLGVLPPAQAAQAMAAADLLLVAMPPGELAPSGTVPLKAYSYLRSGKPIVYLGETGSPTDLLQAFPGTFSFGREFWPRLAAWLGDVQGNLQDHYERPGIERYSFQQLTQALLGILAGAAAGPRAPRPGGGAS